MKKKILKTKEKSILVFSLNHKEKTNKIINFLQNQMHSIILLLYRKEEFQYELIWGDCFDRKGKEGEDFKLGCFLPFPPFPYTPFMHLILCCKEF